jgi:hypothetical protein
LSWGNIRCGDSFVCSCGHPCRVLISLSFRVLNHRRGVDALVALRHFRTSQTSNITYVHRQQKLRKKTCTYPEEVYTSLTRHTAFSIPHKHDMAMAWNGSIHRIQRRRNKNVQGDHGFLNNRSNSSAKHNPILSWSVHICNGSWKTISR